MLKIIHVRPEVIKQNVLARAQHRNYHSKPVMVVHLLGTGEKPKLYDVVRIEGPSTLKGDYSKDGILSAGAHVWIETEAPILCITRLEDEPFELAERFE